MLYIIYFVFIGPRGCSHEVLQRKSKVFYDNITNQEEEPVRWDNIRLSFDVSNILNIYDDPHACNSVGKQIDYNGFAYDCTDERYLQRDTIWFIVQNINSLKDYYKNLFKVIPFNHPIHLTTPNQSSYDISGTINESDLHVTFYLRPLQVATAGASIVVQLENKYKRPIQGIIILDPFVIYHTEKYRLQRHLFNTITHELIHILGINLISFSNHHPIENPTIYPHDDIFCSYTTETGKKINLITSPYSQIFAKKFYGVDKYVGIDNTCPPGIELHYEDNESDITPHPAGRLAFSDIMTSTNIENIGNFTRFTEISMALLMDTGNYKINWSMCQPLVWGNPESINGKPIMGFSNGPPDLVFPKYYLYEDTQVGFDFKMVGFPLLSDEYNCSNITNKYCRAKRFHNPLNSSQIDTSPYFDFLKIKYPLQTCPNHTAVVPGQPSICAPYECDGFKEFSFYYDKRNKKNEVVGTSITCNKKNIGQNITETIYNRILGEDVDIVVTCVDPERFCRSVALQEMKFRNDPFDPQSTQLVEVFKKKYLTKLQFYSILISIGLFFLIITLICGYFILFKMPKRQHKSMPQITEALADPELQHEDL